MSVLCWRSGHHSLVMFGGAGRGANGSRCYGGGWDGNGWLSAEFTSALGALVINSEGVSHPADIAAAAGASFPHQGLAGNGLGLHFLILAVWPSWWLACRECRFQFSVIELPEYYAKSGKGDGNSISVYVFRNKGFK